MSDFDNFVNDLMTNDVATAKAATKAGVVEDKSKKVARNAKLATAKPKARMTQLERRVAALKAFDETNPGLREFLNGAGQWSDFAGSLAEQLVQRGGLSPNQISAANKMRLKVEARENAPVETVAVDLSPIVEMFETAKESGYKRPAYRAEGLVIKPAPAHGRNAGALYVMDTNRVEYGHYGEQPSYAGKLVEGAYTPARNADSRIADVLVIIAKNPRDAAIAYGQRTGRCACCGRELTKHSSVDAGIGPICAEKWGL